MNLKEKYDLLTDLNKQAESGGGQERIEKQHAAGKKSARERINQLLDPGTFVEIDKLVTHRNYDFGMEDNRILGDGLISGYGKVKGRLIYVFAQDFTVFRGSLSRANADKIVKIQKLALQMGTAYFVQVINKCGNHHHVAAIFATAVFSELFLVVFNKVRIVITGNKILVVHYSFKIFY